MVLASTFLAAALVVLSLPLTDSVTFRCIEPLRKLVTTEKKDGRAVNPSRLVMGTNAVLKVGANGPFSPSEVDWHVVSGSTQLVSDGWYATVTPTGTDTVIIEARFNDDEIQPQLVLPVVQPRTIPVRAFVVEPSDNGYLDAETNADNINVAWTNQEICKMLDTANEIFTQVGIHFEFAGEIQRIGRTNDWNLAMTKTFTNSVGEIEHINTLSDQASALFDSNASTTGILVYFTGVIKDNGVVAFRSQSNVAIGREALPTTLSHELGHVLGMKDCYYHKDGVHNGVFGHYGLAIRNDPVCRDLFRPETGDWGKESGRGFYERTDTLAVTMERLLMYGVKTDHEMGDIPDRQIWGFSKQEEIEKAFQNVGAFYIEGETR